MVLDPRALLKGMDEDKAEHLDSRENVWRDILASWTRF